MNKTTQIEFEQNKNKEWALEEQQFTSDMNRDRSITPKLVTPGLPDGDCIKEIVAQ